MCPSVTFAYDKAIAEGKDSEGQLGWVAVDGFVSKGLLVSVELKRTRNNCK
jgi:hypothetical protein